MTVEWGTYEGQWKNDYRYGNGKETNNKGEVFEAFWYDGDTADNVFYTYNGVTKRGKIEKGKFVEAAKNIKKETYSNGYYEGELANGKRNGYGTYYWNSGSRYEGNWVNDVRKGFGRFFWKDGGRYEGEWENDKMNGYGVYYLPSGSVYRGQWKDDQKCNGKQEYSWGSYEGEWANKTWGGYGKEIVYNGPTYEGFWQDNKNATNIVCTYPDGRVAHGKIVDGTFISN